MRVDVELVNKMLGELDAINLEDIRKLEFFENGEPVEISESTYERADLFALNNVHFIRFRLWDERECKLPEG